MPQFEITHIRNPWKERVQIVLCRADDVEVIKAMAEKQEWLYFRRANPRKFEVYIDEDFEPGSPPNPLLDEINRPDSTLGKIKARPNDLLCLHIDGNWMDCVRFEGVWVEALSTEAIIWDHYLVAGGRVSISV